MLSACQAPGEPSSRGSRLEQGTRRQDILRILNDDLVSMLLPETSSQETAAAGQDAMNGPNRDETGQR
jgi:hypothetical protein